MAEDGEAAGIKKHPQSWRGTRVLAILRVWTTGGALPDPSRDAERVKLPYFPFWARDWIAGSVAGMTHEQKGAYVDLLAHQWLMGALPPGPKDLARLIRMPYGRFSKAWRVLRSKFEMTEQGYKNMRMEKVRARALVTYENRCKAAERAREAKKEP